MGGISLLCVSVCGVWAALVNGEMADEVNARLPTGIQFDPLGWHAFKARRLLVEYRRLYPEGTLHRKLRNLSAGGLAALVVAMWGFGFPVAGALWIGIAGGAGIAFGFRRGDSVP